MSSKTVAGVAISQDLLPSASPTFAGLKITGGAIPGGVLTSSTAGVGTWKSIGVRKTGATFPSDWGSNFYTKLAAASTANCTIAVVGDSVSQGLNSSDLWSTSYVARLRSNLQAAYGDGGSGYVGAVNALDKFSSLSGYTPAKTGVTFDASSWSLIRGEGPGSYSSNTLVDGATCSFVVRGSTVTVYYIKASNCGIFTVSIDGSAAVTVNSTSANAIGTYTVTGLSTGSHTVTCVRSAIQGGMYFVICGVRGTNPTGVIIDNYSIVGCTAQMFLTRNGVQYGEPAYWSGGPGIPSDLLIYAMILNDAGNQSGAALNADAFGTTICNHLSAVRNDPATSSPDILFIAPHIGNYQSGSSVKFYLLLSRIYSIALGYGAAVINLSAAYKNSWQYAYTQSLWGTASTDGSGAVGTNAVHPGDTGMSQYAAIILPYLNFTAFRPTVSLGIPMAVARERLEVKAELPMLTVEEPPEDWDDL